jgi:hypothetical protein
MPFLSRPNRSLHHKGYGDLKKIGHEDANWSPSFKILSFITRYSKKCTNFISTLDISVSMTP